MEQGTQVAQIALYCPPAFLSTVATLAISPHQSVSSEGCIAGGMPVSQTDRFRRLPRANRSPPIGLFEEHRGHDAYMDLTAAYAAVCLLLYGRLSGDTVIHRPVTIGAFEFCVLSALRAGQLMRGCLARVEGERKSTVTAQVEVAAGKVTSTGAELSKPTPHPVDEPRE